MGVYAVRASTAEDFTQALEYALATPGPHLIEALVPESLSGAKRKLLPWLLKSLLQPAAAGGAGAEAKDSTVVESDRDAHALRARRGRGRELGERAPQAWPVSTLRRQRPFACATRGLHQDPAKHRSHWPLPPVPALARSLH